MKTESDIRASRAALRDYMGEPTLTGRSTMDTNLEYHRALIDEQLRGIWENLALFPKGRHKVYFALLSVHQLGANLSRIEDLSHESKLLLGHEISERISYLLEPDESQ